MNNKDEATVMKFDNGFSFVKVKFSGDFELRDADNKRHLTIEYNEENNKIHKIKGKGDILATGYDDMISDFCTKLQPESITLDAYAISEDGKYYVGENAINNIPEGEKLKKAVIINTKNITHWNHDVSVFFHAGGSNLERVADGVKFGGRVYINNCKNIKEWNNDVAGDFYADKSGLERVADGVKIGGEFNAYDSSLKSIGDNVKIDGEFNAISSKKLESIGDNVTFGGRVKISGCYSIKEWNNDVAGDFYASYSGLERIGDNVKIGGDFHVANSKLETIGTNVEIGGYFYARDSELETIGENVKIGGETNIQGTPLERKLQQQQEPEEESHGMRR